MRLLETWRGGFADEAEKLLGNPDSTDGYLEELPGLLERWRAIHTEGDAALLAPGTPRPIWPMDATTATDIFDDLDPGYRSALRRARDSILDFYRRQKPSSWFSAGASGEMSGQWIVPLERAAFLFPRGWRFSPTSLMMFLAPAYVAGVEELYVNLPPGEDGEAVEDFAIALAWDWDVRATYSLDPIDAVFAFTAGTETVPRADIIISNGGKRIRHASTLVSSEVAAKVISDSNETAILADVDADARVLAVDLFALSEDPALTRLTVLTPSMVLANELEEEIEKVATRHPSGKAARGRLAELGVLILTRSLDEALDLLGRYPPKHLSLFVESPLDVMSEVHHAGVIYLGQNTPAGIEHYFASASNLIPAGGGVALRGPLGVEEFMKTSSLVHYNPRKVQQMHEVIAALARGEDLPFHEAAFRIRMDS